MLKNAMSMINTNNAKFTSSWRCGGGYQNRTHYATRWCFVIRCSISKIYKNKFTKITKIILLVILHHIAPMKPVISNLHLFPSDCHWTIVCIAINCQPWLHLLKTLGKRVISITEKLTAVHIARVLSTSLRHIQGVLPKMAAILDHKNSVLTCQFERLVIQTQTLIMSRKTELVSCTNIWVALIQGRWKSIEFNALLRPHYLLSDFHSR